jgi:2-C-methyl-D-erythritol 4-phosphate cytidylyltransferase
LIRQAVIVAGGMGSRFDSSLPKQFTELAGKPLLFYSLLLFKDIADDIVLVLPETQIELWHSLFKKHQINFKHVIAAGGETRTASVKNGLDKLPVAESVIAIHDAARPLVTAEHILKLYGEAEEYGSAIPVIQPRDSVRQISNSNTGEPVNREKIVLVQTPQIFRSEIIRESYADKCNTSYSDDATLVEDVGHKVHLSEGELWNMKITWPEDMVVAETLINFRRGN